MRVTSSRDPHGSHVSTDTSTKQAGSRTGQEDPQEEEIFGDSEEARVAKTVTSVREPTEEERENHEATHLPFRSWCSHCVRAKAANEPHMRRTGEDKHRLPTMSVDYFFMGSNGVIYGHKGKELGHRGKELKDKDQDEEEGLLPMIAIYDHDTRIPFAHACPCSLAWTKEDVVQVGSGTGHFGTKEGCSSGTESG